MPTDSPWPLAQWGIEIVGPFPVASGTKEKYLVVAVDYFTKWAEAHPLKNITATQMNFFVCSDIVCRFGTSEVLVTDNGTQFDCEQFRVFCGKLGIRNHYSSPAHPQANGQVEVTNRTIL